MTRHDLRERLVLEVEAEWSIVYADMDEAAANEAWIRVQDEADRRLPAAIEAEREAERRRAVRWAERRAAWRAARTGEGQEALAK